MDIETPNCMSVESSALVEYFLNGSLDIKKQRFSYFLVLFFGGVGPGLDFFRPVGPTLPSTATGTVLKIAKNPEAVDPAGKAKPPHVQ